MTKLKREWYEGASYHITARGNRRNDIFRDEEDFQDRYFSEIIEDDTQLLEASRYVHLNPVKARIVEWPEEYKWSSYPMLIGEIGEKLIDSEIILNYFKYERRFELYKEFVEKHLKSLRESLKLEDE